MGNTIGHILISYDINRSHTEVKRKLEEKGYLDHFKYQGASKTYYLPNTTLWHTKMSSSQALEDLKSVCQMYSVVLEKAVAVKASEFIAI
ncbi:MAG: hypothetical protein VYB38_15395 [Bacteroidota bacterium]|uniref:hypothetical protein n=1 Tax=Leeuwenhoekiella palythoae TaxID=573501 RepID=UPI001CE22AB4|nr:hypothetical protein [Leeuwenhoekiella palythoae]MEC7784797.1 hypothetical protein [Bacteroidota bacterium]UBZ11405.1 hypothetical protein LDL79_04630 [Leeuwenhoekiella palythoae]